MKDLLNSQPYKLIFAVAMSKTQWLQRIPREYDRNAETSYVNLKKIVSAEGKDILRTMTLVHLDLKRKYSERKTLENGSNVRFEFSIYNLLWARMYVIAYFYYHDDPFWKKALSSEMLELVPNTTIIRGDVITAVNAINIYFQKEAKFAAYAMMPSEEGAGGSTAPSDSGRIAELEQAVADKDMEISELKAQIAELQQQLEEAQGNSTANGPSEKQLEETFTYPFRQKQGYPLLIDFLLNEVKTASDIEWARHALAIFDNSPSVILNKPADFKSWLVDFCNLFGRKWVRDYEPMKLRNVKGKRAKKSKVDKFLPTN